MRHIQLHQVKWNRSGGASAAGLKLPGGLSLCWLQGEVSITSSVCGGLKSGLLSAVLLQAKPQSLDCAW